MAAVRGYLKYALYYYTSLYYIGAQMAGGVWH